MFLLGPFKFGTIVSYGSPNKECILLGPFKFYFEIFFSLQDHNCLPTNIFQIVSRYDFSILWP